jgi:predicted permease
LSPLVETIFHVFGLVGIGWLSGVTGYFKPEVGDSLADFAVSLAVPLLLFKTISSVEFGGHAPWALWATYFTAVFVAWVAGHQMIRRGFGRDARAGVVSGVSTSFSNLVLLGIPFILGVFGDEGFAVLSLLVSIHLPIMMAASISQFEWAQRADGVEMLPMRPLMLVADFLKKLFSNPLIIGIVGGLVFRLSGLEMPRLGARYVDAIAGVAGPVALFAMGLGLNKFGIKGNIVPALCVSALKLFLMPSVALVMALLLGLPELTAKVVVVCAALPSGVNPYLIATRFGTGQALASNAMTTGTALAALTTGVWLVVVNAVF